MFDRWRGIAGKKDGAMRLAGPVSIGALNQAIRSGSNLLLGLYLINVLEPVHFGLFGIGISISIFLYSIANTVFFLQMVVHTPDKPQESRPAYAAHIFVLVVLFCLAVIAVVMPALSGVQRIWQIPQLYSELARVVTMVSCAVIFKEFFVRHAYNTKNEISALRIELVLTATLVLLLLWQHYSGSTMSAFTALWIYTGAHLLAGVFALIAARLPLMNISVTSLRAAASEAWLGGRWESITGIIYFGRSQAPIIAASYFLGPVGVAKLNAARLLVSPALIVAPAITQVALTRISDLRARGAGLVLNRAFLVSLALLSVAFAYCALLLAGFDWLVPLLLDNQYADIFNLTLVWCLFACILAFRSGNQLGIYALRQFRFFATANATAAVTAIVSSGILAYQFGLAGAISSAVLAELVLVIMMLRFGRRFLAQEAQPGPDGDNGK